MVISTPNKIKLDINIPDFPKNENGLTQLIRMGKSIRHIRVKKVEGLYCLCEIRHLIAQLICAFVFAYLKYRFYHDVANWLIYHVRK